MDLSGAWRAAVADEELRRSYPDPDFDDSGWATLDVPSHWRSNVPFTATEGPLLARTRFETETPAEGTRAWLTFEGVFYQADVWLDGGYVGDTEGYFFPHTFEVTDRLRERTEHVLATEVTCAPQRDRKAKRNLTGVFQHWDCFDPDWNPGGIWRPVRLHETGPVRISRMRVLCGEASDALAVLVIRVVLDAKEAATVSLRTQVGAHTDHELEQTVAAGENRIEWRVGVENPTLWWPHSLGAQPLEDVAVTVSIVGDNTEVSDARSVRTGLRQVRMKQWITTVNGERIFLKGANHGPTRMAIAEASVDDVEQDVLAARDAGLDLLRVHAHVARPEVYDAADRAGMLLWQDMPLQWGYARSVRKQAARQAREAVDLLGHHPSIAIWCGHNEPLALDIEPGLQPSAKTVARFLAGQELPTFNKTILDRSVKRSLDKADPTRPVIAHSGVLPHPGSGGTDSHLYFGWYHGEERDLPGFARLWPRMVRFVSEFGAQAVPDSSDFAEPERWPDLDWEHLARHHALQRDNFSRVGLDPGDFETFAEWQEATQQYQAEVIRFHVETLRRLKYRPTGGFCHFLFADGHPGITWSVRDHERKPKAGWHALVEACRPIIVVADRPEDEYAPGDALALDVHVVNDLRVPVEGTVAARIAWIGGEHEWRWSGSVGADDVARVGTLQMLVPDAPGALTIELGFHAGARATAEAVYRSRIA
ncbi:MAG: glycoside hydrolase family 2 protein [Acidimicrobiia bacterium]